MEIETEATGWSFVAFVVTIFMIGRCSVRRTKVRTNTCGTQTHFETLDLEELTIERLRSRLAEAGQKTSGLKAELVVRLRDIYECRDGPCLRTELGTRRLR